MADPIGRRAFLTAAVASPFLVRHALARSPGGPYSMRVIMSGHSLTDPIPGPLAQMVKAVAGGASRGMVIDSETVPGSPIEIRWNDEHGLVPDARKDLRNYDMLVLTERVPVRAAMQYHHTKDLALQWSDLAWTEGNGGKGASTVLYASWITVDSGPDNQDWNDFEERLIPFRDRLELEMGSWQEVADHVNANRVAGSPAMRVIPGPLVMAAVFDAIAAGTAPGLSAMTELFRDTIHVNGLGAFLAATAHFAVMYGEDPRQVPVLNGQGDWPSAAQQDWMKDLVWEVVRRYPGSGLA